ncbi:MAG: D-2-hydroxyacid dehydrogenase [Deltaproteobacteria bacterium]|nr:D-2-hydroxyacid dehydrogenase [Deltaproteobacteria bacterium]
MNRIVVLDGFVLNPGDLPWDSLKALGDVTIFDRTPSALVAERLSGYNLVLTNKTKITAELIEQAADLKYIGVLATGYDMIDIEAAKKRGVIVTNVPEYGSMAVCQHAISLLLEITNRVGHHSQAVHEGRWIQSRDWSFWDYPLNELSGQTMGIIGLGRIGVAIAKAAHSLGMKITADQDHSQPMAPEWVEYLPFDDLIAGADVLNLSCPLYSSNAGLINKATIERMRNGVIIINTSRGGLIVDDDLAQALHSGKVAAAGLDVISQEPIRPENPLLGAPNCFITPHIAGSPKASRGRLLAVAVRNLSKFLSGTPINVVNP